MAGLGQRTADAVLVHVQKYLPRMDGASSVQACLALLMVIEKVEPMAGKGAA